MYDKKNTHYFSRIHESLYDHRDIPHLTEEENNYLYDLGIKVQ